MRLHRIAAALGVFAALTLAAPAGHAFTIENKDSGGGGSAYKAPDFDLGEQSKQFSRDNAAAATTGTTGYSTKFGNGTFELGVGQGTNYGGTGFGMSPSMFAPSFGLGNNRSDFNRVVTPENLR